MTSSNGALVIGAGIGGLAAALALMQRGLDVTVYEQAPQLKEIGAARFGA
jgi:salicylate hydroxylase